MNTIEMIQKVKHGDSVKSTNWDVELYCSCGDIIVTKNGKSDKLINEPLGLTNLVLNDMQWKIMPKQIDFTHAVSIIRSGGVVTALDSKKEVVTVYDNLYDSLDFYGIIYDTYFEGEHTLEDLI